MKRTHFEWKISSILIMTTLGLLLVVLTAGSEEARGKTITVDDDGGADHTSIQDAIDAAEDGDTIRVFSGTYVEEIEVNKPLNIQGNGSQDTFIQAPGSEFAVGISASNVNFTGFSIRGSNNGIGVFGSGNLVSRNNCSGLITGIMVIWFMEQPDNNIISDNECYNCNVGISVGGGDNNIVSGNEITSGNYIGIRVQSDNNLVSGNIVAGIQGDGIVLDGGYNNSITGNVMEDNSAVGISLENTLMAFIRENICSNNSGEGIALQDGEEIRDVFIENNTCFGNQNEGIGVSYASSVIVSNNLVYDNMNGIIIDASSDIIVKNNIVRDQSNGISIMFDSVNVSVVNGTIVRNTYGISFEGASGTVIRDCNILDNEIGIYYSDESENNTVINCNIRGNSEYGIDASDNDGYTINASNNWWGAASGPYHIAKNPEGEGDNITDDVLFDPWLDKAVNSPPTAYIDSISPNPAVEEERILFTGHGTDDGSIIRYAWRSSIDGEFHNGTESEKEYDELSNGTHTIYFKVQDNHGIWSDEVTDTLAVNGIPRAYISSISPDPAVEGETVSFEGQGTDDGSIEQYVWRSSIDGEIHNSSESANFNADDLSVGEHTISFKVQDNHGVWSDEVSTTLTITEYIPPNQKPTITITSPANNSEISGVITITGSVSDEDGDETIEKVEVSVNSGGWEMVNGTTDWNFQWDTNNIDNGEYSIKVRSYDGTNYSEEVSITVTVGNKGKDGGEDDDDGGFIQGFGTLLVIAGMVVSMGLYRRKK